MIYTTYTLTSGNSIELRNLLQSDNFKSQNSTLFESINSGNIPSPGEYLCCSYSEWDDKTASQTFHEVVLLVEKIVKSFPNSKFPQDGKNVRVFIYCQNAALSCVDETIYRPGTTWNSGYKDLCNDAFKHKILDGYCTHIVAKMDKDKKELNSDYIIIGHPDKQYPQSELDKLPRIADFLIEKLDLCNSSPLHYTVIHYAIIWALKDFYHM